MIELKKSDKAPFTGVLMPVDSFYDYEKSQRQLDYILANPIKCDECSDSTLEPLFMGAILGALLGFSLGK